MTDHHPAPAEHKSPGIGFERMVFFSDAVFAIAITLLVLDLKLPPQDHGVIVLEHLIPKLLGFAISFAVIGVYWMAHHRLFETLKAHDIRVMRLNLLFLAAVVFLPFPTSLVTEPGQRPAAVIFYACSVASLGVLMALLALTARRPGLMRAGETQGWTVYFAMRAAAPPTIFIASTLLAPYWPTAAMYSWILVWPAVRIMERIGKRIGHRIDVRHASEAAAS